MSNTGALFKNDKGGVEKRPDYRGDITIEGVKYNLSSWLKKDVKGRTYMSIEATKQVSDITEEDIPF